MKILNSIAFLFLFAFISLSSSGQYIDQIWFPDNLSVFPKCNSRAYDTTFQITTNSDLGVKLYSFRFNPVNLKLYCHGKELTSKDTILITKKQPATIKTHIKTIPFNLSNILINFNCSIDTIQAFEENSVNLLFNDFVFSDRDFFEHRKNIIEISKSCLDTIRVWFPIQDGGTTISYYRSRNSKKPLRIRKYFPDKEKVHFITIKKSDKGFYHFKTSSPYKFGDSWLILK